MGDARTMGVYLGRVGPAEVTVELRNGVVSEKKEAGLKRALVKLRWWKDQALLHGKLK